MRKLLTALAFACVSLAFIVTPAEARRHPHRTIVQPPQEICWVFCDFPRADAAPADWRNQRKRHLSNDGMGSRPRAWCGWYMRQLTGITDKSLNLARNWAHVGTRAAGPAPGVIGVWHNHVVRVEQVLPGGKILATSGNDGGAVRTRVRSARGAIAWRHV